MFEFIEKMEPNAVIKVIGVGGGGGNAVSHMVNAQIEGVEFVFAHLSQAFIRKGTQNEVDLLEASVPGLKFQFFPAVFCGCIHELCISTPTFPR